MTMHSVAELIRATGSLRSGDPAAVAAVVRQSLALAGLGDGPAGVKNAAADGLAGGSPVAVMTIIEESLALAGLGTGGVAASTGPRPNLSGDKADARQRLSAVIEALRAGRLELNLPGMRAPVPPISVPPGAQFLERHFTSAAGSRRYRLYIPSTAGDGLQGLVMMLHGCNQNPEDFAAGTGMNALAEQHRLLVVYPGQAAGENSMACWNWFRPGDQMRGSGEPAILAGLTEALCAEHGLARDRLFVAGLSAGGAMAAILGETYPDLYAAVGVHSGLPSGSASDVPSAFAAMRGQGAPRAPRRAEANMPRLIVFHGTADATVHPANARQILAARTDQTFERTAYTPAGSRPYTRLVARDTDGRHEVECWMIEEAGHAWAGGRPDGSYTDPAGPDASAAMLRFFLQGDGRADDA